MPLTLEQVCKKIDGRHLDELDMKITRDGQGFAVEDFYDGSPVSDIGSSYEVPEDNGDKGRVRFTAGPWDAWEYNAAYTAPHRDNYLPYLEDLAAGDTAAVICGYACLDDTWVFGLRVIDND